jgi:hypothetical protein
MTLHSRCLDTSKIPLSAPSVFAHITQKFVFVVFSGCLTICHT